MVVSGMPGEQREAALAQMLGYLVPPLQQAVQSSQEAPAVLLIDRITIIFRRACDMIHSLLHGSLMGNDSFPLADRCNAVCLFGLSCLYAHLCRQLTAAAR